MGPLTSRATREYLSVVLSHYAVTPSHRTHRKLSRGALALCAGRPPPPSAAPAGGVVGRLAPLPGGAGAPWGRGCLVLAANTRSVAVVCLALVA